VNRIVVLALNAHERAQQRLRAVAVLRRTEKVSNASQNRGSTSGEESKFCIRLF
jgi:hypothetical protein